MRKGRCIILIGSLFPLCIHGQILNTPYNLPRSGDRLMKCQIATIPPSKSGIQQIWNFANIKYQEANYELKYEVQGSDTIIGIEHRTIYYYRNSGDSLFCMGFENPTTFISYQQPELLFVYPMFQGRTISKYFEGKGNYCNHFNIHLCGKVIVKADASGILILPGGDTIQNVLRTYTHKYVHQKMTSQKEKNKDLSLEAFPFSRSKDSIDYLLANDSIHLEIETWHWYAVGNRYPLFETVKSTVCKLGTSHEHFSTSFAYLPHEQNYDLPYDSENEECKNRNEEQNRKMQNSLNRHDTRSEIINYNLHINKEGNIKIKYELKQNNDISLLLYDLEGRQLFAKSAVSQLSGHYHETIQIEKQSRGKYLLIIIVGDKKYVEKIVKF